MYLKLHDALDDFHANLALKRLYNLRRLRELKAPPLVVEKAEELLAKSRVEMGDRFDDLEGLYSEYATWAEEAQRVEREWQERCESCQHIIAGVDDEDVETWCEKYTAEERTIPEPCPDYRGRDDMGENDGAMK